MTSNKIVVSGLALVLVGTTGCSTVMSSLSGILGGAKGAASPTSGSSSSGGGKVSPESLAGLEKVMTNDVQNCERQAAMASRKFDDAMGTFDTTKDKTSALVMKARGQKVKVWIEIATPEVPLPIVRDSFMDEGKALPNPPQGPKDTALLQAFAKRSMKVQPILTPLRTEVSGVGGALGGALFAMQACRPYTDAYAHQFVGLKRSGSAPTAAMTDLYKRLVDASARSDAMFASAVALIGTMEAGFDNKDPKGIDQAVEGIKQSPPSQISVSDEDRQAKIDKVEKDLPPVDGADVKAPPPAATSQGAAGGLTASGPLGDVLASVQAIAKGDYFGAMKSAANLAPAPLGPMFGKIASLFG